MLLGITTVMSSGEHLTSTSWGFSALYECFTFNATSHETQRTHTLTHDARTSNTMAKLRTNHRYTNTRIHDMTYAGTYHTQTTDKPHAHKHTDTPHTCTHQERTTPTLQANHIYTKIKTSSLKFFASFLNFKDKENHSSSGDTLRSRREAHGTEAARDPSASYVITRF